MKVSYDADVDAVYLELLKSEPEGVIQAINENILYK